MKAKPNTWLNEMEDNQIAKILKDNGEIPWVKRILNPNSYKPLKLENGMIASHLMAYGGGDGGKFYVYPTVLMTQKGLKQFSSDEAWDTARKTGNLITFDSEKEASEFSENYKRAWQDDYLKK